MADTQATGHPHAGHRTFDCPWCGAISSIPGDHLGEHFTCPECKKATKLTEKNTSALKPTAPPPDAPHLSGDRTFDCPWCGAIASIGVEYVGEHFTCPECSKSTKITEKNTTRRPVTAPPPDAPHVEGSAGGGRKAAIGVLVLVALAVGVWIAMPKKDGGAKDGKTVETAREGTTGIAPRPPSGTEARPPAETPASAPPPTMPAGTAAPPLVEAPPAPSVEPPPTAPDSPEVAAAKAALAEARARVATTEDALEAARGALAEWEAKNPDAKDTVSNLAALNALTKEAERMRSAIDPAKATPDQVRGYNLGVATYVGSDAKRTRVAQALFERLQGEVAGRGTLGLAWTDMNFYGPGFERAAKDLSVRWLTAPASPPELRRAETEAAEALSAAKQAEAEAQKALDALTGR
jgi:hypothetical protein